MFEFAMIYRLIFLSGPRTGERITITEEPMVVGRDADCAVTVPDLEVARKHAALQQKDDELFIRDLGSMNRILVNKREVREGRLKHGDEIELGRGATESIPMMPKMGNKTTGNKLVTNMFTDSVIHQYAINTNTPAILATTGGLPVQ